MIIYLSLVTWPSKPCGSSITRPVPLSHFCSPEQMNWSTITWRARARACVRECVCLCVYARARAL